MTGREQLSPGVTVYMIEEEASFAEWECIDSQKGSSSEGALFISVPSARAFSQVGASPSGRQVREEEVDFEDIEVVYFEEDPDMVEPEVT